MDEFLRTDHVLNEVRSERQRQDRLKASGKFLWTCADNEALRNKLERAITNAEKLAVLAEEFGEAACEVTEEIIGRDRGDVTHADKSVERLRKELVQVAAVCVAWVEAIDKRAE